MEKPGTIEPRQFTRAKMRPEMSWDPFDISGRSRRFGLADAFLLFFLFAGASWFVAHAIAETGYVWRWSLLLQYVVRPEAAGQGVLGFEAGLLLRGLACTLRLGCWAMLVALVLGIVVGVASTHSRGLRAMPARLYVHTIRNVPPLILLFLMYFVVGAIVPLAELDTLARTLPPWAGTVLSTVYAPPGQLDRMTAAVVTLGMYEGAYVAEIVRGVLESVPRGQWEAASALGFKRWQCAREVIVPQVVPMLASPLVGQTVSTFKDSALAALISLPELTFQGFEIMAVSRMTYEPWIVCAALYLAIGVFCASIGKRLEQKPWRR